MSKIDDQIERQRMIDAALFNEYIDRRDHEVAILRRQLDEARKTAICDYICDRHKIAKAWAKYDGPDAFIDFVMAWLAANREGEKVIDAKIKEAWDWLNRHGISPSYFHVVMEAYVQAEARARMAEFKLTSYCITAERVRHGVRVYRTNFDDNDPCHKWTLADWEAELRRELSK